MKNSWSLSRGIIGTIVTLLSLQSWAVAPEAETPVVAPAPEVLSTRGVLPRRRSADNRKDKNFQAIGQIGIHLTDLPMAGVGFATFLTSDTLLLAEYAGVSSADDWVSDTRTKARITGVQIKHFTGNSFYLKTGAEYREVNMAVDNDWIFYNTVDANEGATIGVNRHVAATFAIGNQWQFGGFTMGCDWVGIGVKVAQFRDKYNETVVEEYDRSDAKDQWEDHTGNLTAQFARFYLGASF